MDSGACNSTVSYPDPRVLDNCAATLSLISGPASSAVFRRGLTNVSFSAVDQSGLSRSCTFSITVLDLERPSLG